MPSRASLGYYAFVIALAAACGAPPGAAPSSPEVTVPPDAAKSPLAKATGYDAAGKELACAAPRADCPDAAPDRDFLDKCKLAGFQTRRCGCETLCAGNAAKARSFYDAAGSAKACTPATPSCSAPAASASFQDACTDKGYRLTLCECEWLCSGNPTKG